MTETTATDATAAATGGEGRKANILLWVLQVLGAVTFAFAGVVKLMADPPTVEGFEAMGLGVTGMYIVGVLEVAGAVGLLLPGVAGFAGVCLVALMIGATVATVAVMGLQVVVAVPLVTLIVVAVIAWGRRRTIPKFVNALLGR